MVYQITVALTTEADSEEEAKERTVAALHSWNWAKVVTATATELPPIIGTLNLTDMGQGLT
jgi:hypothetical protein